MDRKKRLKKGIISLEKQISEHQKKIEEYKGPKDFLIDYWEKEIEGFKKEKKEKEKKFKKE